MKRMKLRMIMGLLISAIAMATLAADTNQKTETFDLAFPGGPPAKLVDAIERTSGTRPNVLISPRLANTVLPKMELHGVTESSVFMALNALANNDLPGNWRPANNVWIFQGRPEFHRTQVFYVGDLLQKFKIEDITTAIQTIGKLDGKEAGAELKFHQETQLLIARADEDQLGGIKELLNELRRALPHPDPRADRVDESSKAGQARKP
jgi:hypothetical protein